MSASASAVQEIVDSHCKKLLHRLQKECQGAAVGISVALYYPGNPAVTGFFPYGQAAPGVAITPDTVYAIGSVTKLFSATLAAYLQVKNVIDLKTTPVGPYLFNTGCQTPKVSGSYWDQVPFLAFATHTSGMPDEATRLGPYSTPLFNDEPPSCDLIQWWNSNQSSFAQMQGLWNYSSAGFVTLGFATAQVASENGYPGGYTTLLSQIITGPFGMSNTFPADFVPAGAQLAQGYYKGAPKSVTGAEDLKSSARDQLDWLTAVYQTMQVAAGGGNLTDVQQAILLTTQEWPPPPLNWKKQPTDFVMGLAWQISTFGQANVLFKNGATSAGGCSCWVGLTKYAADVPAVGIALMTNLDGAKPDPTARTILEQIVALG